MDLYKNKYRVKSTRWQDWDYNWDGAYFITICVDKRAHLFGEIRDAEMNLSPIGAIADVLWHEIRHHATNVELGEFVVMPNHLHGILIINGNDVETLHATSPQNHATSLPNHATSPPNHATSPQNHATSPQNHATSPQNHATSPPPELMSQISPKSNSISAIIRSYKSSVTKHCHRLNLKFQWQSRFYDHVIRNADEFRRISEYIQNNPVNWQKDKLNGGIGNIVLDEPEPYGQITNIEDFR